VLGSNLGIGSVFNFLCMKYGNNWFQMQENVFFFANFHIFGLFIPKKQIESKTKFVSLLDIVGRNL
jgi:hypothetical protein